MTTEPQWELHVLPFFFFFFNVWFLSVKEEAIPNYYNVNNIKCHANSSKWFCWDVLTSAQLASHRTRRLWVSLLYQSSAIKANLHHPPGCLPGLHLWSMFAQEPSNPWGWEITHSASTHGSQSTVNMWLCCFVFAFFRLSKMYMLIKFVSVSQQEFMVPLYSIQVY